MFNRYRFESEVYESLDRIPLDVRMKLDRTGAKISLKDWSAFSLQERWALCDLPVECRTVQQRHGAPVDQSKHHVRPRTP